jgi:uncharacterized protein with HEPN domain
MHKYDLYVKDILDAIAKIERTTKSVSKEKFSKNIDLIDMTLMRIQVIGESIIKLPSEIKKKKKNVDWEKARVMRNLISHAYFKVSIDTIWDIIINELPKIKKSLQDLK